jgi:hypothetical protein
VKIDPSLVDPKLYIGRENVPLVDEATQARYYADVIRLVKCDPTVATLDLFLYRPLLVWARLRGTWDFMRGRRDWDKFERNARPSAQGST